MGYATGEKFPQAQLFTAIAIASIVRTKVLEHALWRPVNNQRHPDICGYDF